MERQVKGKAEEREKRGGVGMEREGEKEICESCYRVSCVPYQNS